MSCFESLLADLEVCQGSTDTSDMVIECEDEEIPVHSVILSHRYIINLLLLLYLRFSVSLKLHLKKLILICYL